MESIRGKLKRLVEDSDTLSGRVFDSVSQFLVLISLVSFAIETVKTLPSDISRVLDWMELVIVSLFTMEYFLRLLVADKKIGFVFSFYGLIDLAAILPFYITVGVDLRSIRILRIFRLFRVFKIVRYSKALGRLKRAFYLVRDELVMFIFATALLLYVASVGIYYFENVAQPDKFASVIHTLWWAVVTLTTVGYGDMVPITVGGKAFSAIITLLGLGIVAIPTGLLTSAMIRTMKEE